MNLSSEPARLALLVILAAALSGAGYVLTDEIMGQGEEPPAPAAEPNAHPEAAGHDSGLGPEEHPGASPVKPSEEPIFEFWEDEYFPFVGFEPEQASAQEVRGARPHGQRRHEGDSMVLIPAGAAPIGDPSLPGSRPARSVHVPAFRIDRYEVTNRRYQAFIRATNRKVPYVHENWAAIYNWTGGEFPKGLGEVPVVLVTWRDADAFCRWSGRRLPTEIEWEKAARGSDGRRYPWGSVWDSRRTNVVSRLSGPLQTEKQWDAFETGWTGSKRPEIFPGGSFPGDRSPSGVMDMGGNVSEWVSGTFVAYPNAPVNDRVKLGSGLRVARGNSWGNRDYSTPAAIRYPYEETRVDSVIGFRCAQTIP